MIKCVNCGGPAEGLNSRLVNLDGDFACSNKCFREYDEKRRHFFEEELSSEARTKEWLFGIKENNKNEIRETSGEGVLPFPKQ